MFLSAFLLVYRLGVINFHTVPFPVFFVDTCFNRVLDSAKYYAERGRLYPAFLVEATPEEGRVRPPYLSRVTAPPVVVPANEGITVVCHNSP